MISLKVAIFLAIGTVFMFIPICIQSHWYGIKFWKRIVLAICLTVCGTIGTYILFYLEVGKIGGISFYGAVFFVPVLFIAISKLLKLPYGELLSVCGPAECIMLVIMKVQCFTSGCCAGRVLYYTDAGVPVNFPSQIVESANALVLCVVLMIIAKKSKYRNTVYPWYMILYGITRFVLNIFRKEWVTTKMFMPIGNIWSIVSCIIGVGCLYYIIKHKKETA
jgi:phosphatidylglycerol:prolipoprotein diacylglycerol transferase